MKDPQAQTGPGGPKQQEAAENKDRHLWSRDDTGYGPSIHVTKDGAIGISVGGHVIVMPVEMWHRCGKLRLAFLDALVAEGYDITKR